MTEITRETLELAALAAGIEFGIIHQRPHRRCAEGWTPWRPHTDIADAARLAVRMGLSVEQYPYYSAPKHSVVVKLRVGLDQMRSINPTEVIRPYGDSPELANCRAITMCAAQIGRRMREGGP